MSEIGRLMSQQGHRQLAVRGMVDVVVRNDDGSIAGHHRSRNMVLDTFRVLLASMNSSLWGFDFNTNQIMFIHENNQPIFKHGSTIRSVLAGTRSASVTWTIDGPNRLWSTGIVIASGQPTRTFQSVGIAYNQSLSGAGGITGGYLTVLAMTLLSAPVTQLNTQSLELTYRFSFSRN